jgi:hypothetical protein
MKQVIGNLLLQTEADHFKESSDIVLVLDLPFCISLVLLNLCSNIGWEGNFLHNCFHFLELLCAFILFLIDCPNKNGHLSEQVSVDHIGDDNNERGNCEQYIRFGVHLIPCESHYRHMESCKILVGQVITRVDLLKEFKLIY